MTEENKKICETCHGKKMIQGTCECNMEWRGNQLGDEWEDCQCTPEIQCPECKGTGIAE